MKASTILLFHSFVFSHSFVYYVAFFYTKQNSDLFSWIFAIWFMIVPLIVVILSQFDIVEYDLK